MDGCNYVEYSGLHLSKHPNHNKNPQPIVIYTPYMFSLRKLKYRSDGMFDIVRSIFNIYAIHMQSAVLHVFVFVCQYRVAS